MSKNRHQSQQKPAQDEVVTTSTEEVTTVDTLDTTQPEEVTETVEPIQEQPQPVKTGASNVYAVELELNQFVEAMDTKKVHDPENVGRWQYSLFSVIRKALAKEQEDFNKEWNTILQVANREKNGVFSDYYAFRNSEAWPGSSNEYVNYRRLVYLIIQTADPKARKKNLAELKLDTLTSGLTAEQSGKLFSFYGV